MIEDRRAKKRYEFSGAVQGIIVGVGGALVFMAAGIVIAWATSLF